MINRKFKRMVSVFLCFAVAAGLVPLSAAAVEKQPEIVSELTEMRDEYEKHFLMSDGTVAAAVYAESVHYRSDGEWKEIDNSLIDGGETLHTSGESGFYASFRKDAYTGALVGISYEDVKLSWTVQVVGKNGIVTDLSKDTEAAQVRASDPGAEAYAARKT